VASILIRGLSPRTVKRIKALAAKAGMSMNRYLLGKLEGEAGGGVHRKTVHHDLDHLMGTMTGEDLEALCRSVDEQRRVDSELWS
jgi:hypothetical protein